MSVNKLEKEFLKESNAIEGEYEEGALRDAEVAWSYIQSVKGPLVTNDVKQIHYLIMQNLRPDIAGQWRKCAVRIGNQIKKEELEVVIEAKVESVLGLINNAKPTERNMNHQGPITRRKEMRNIEARTGHILFENIHPFEDGNGRVGRILWAYHRQKLRLPIQVIHADFNEKGWDGEQGSYYKWFR